MNNIFSSLNVYGDKWQKKSERTFSQAEIEMVASAEVTTSANFEDKLSVCFHMKAGGVTYLPVSNTVDTTVGEIVDLSKCKLAVLGRNGSADMTVVEW